MNRENANDYLPLVQALAEGKTIEARLSYPSASKDWTALPDLTFDNPPECYRIKPWSLSRHIHGFRELAEGEEWHRQDFTEDMLPEGWRPLLKGEPIHLGDELRGHTGEWCVRDDTEGHPACDECPHRRARRPLPLLPEPVRMVPLEPSDVPPGSFLRKEHWAWSAIQCNNGSEVGVVLPFMGSSITWLSMCTLKDEGWQILRPGSPEWQPCTKEARS